MSELMLTRDQRDARPCRSCRHYDCMMSRGEPLPEHVTAYDGDVLYQPGSPPRGAEQESTDVQAKEDDPGV